MHIVVPPAFKPMVHVVGEHISKDNSGGVI